MGNKLKAIAMYLPQFHNVEENNLWWGEGFTDWKSMESAKPLYDGHQQPKCPQNDYKYDLLLKETMQWQEQLMKKHDVYGLCFYHYWFKEGKRILEKPAENLLQWTDIDMPFCFCWANEAWVRSWSKINNANVWAGNFEKKSQNERADGVLLEQDYGREQEWSDHFQYLLPFFKDDRYIKKDGKPVFVIYQAASIPCLKEMLYVWNGLAEENELGGIYIIGANCGDSELEFLDAGLIHEPAATIQREFFKRFSNKERLEVARYLPYEKVCSASLEFEYQAKGKLYLGGFVNYDDTPRRGSGGTVIFNGNPNKFKLYLTELYAKNASVGNEFVFVNAWNEWGEGMYLEPDEKDGEGYLEAFRYAQQHYKEEIYKYRQKNKSDDDVVKSLRADKDRYYNESVMFDKWLNKKSQKESLTDYFSSRNYNRIAIYGFGAMGKHLLNEINNDDTVQCVYIIDRNAEMINVQTPVYRPEEDLEPVDLIVVSTIHIYDEIYEFLNAKGEYRVMSLKQIIEEW